MVRSTTGTQFIASHVANTGSDGLIGVPWRNEPIFGVRSVNMLVGGGAMMVNYTALGSDGSNFVQWVLPTMTNTHAGGGARGSQPGMRVTGDALFAASQLADTNGTEATNYYPTSLLETQYFIRVTTNYISIVCPTPGQTVTITRPSSAPTNVVCTNPSGVAGAPGHAYSGLTASGFPAGTRVESTAPSWGSPSAGPTSSTWSARKLLGLGRSSTPPPPHELPRRSLRGRRRLGEPRLRHRIIRRLRSPLGPRLGAGRDHVQRADGDRPDRGRRVGCAPRRTGRHLRHELRRGRRSRVVGPRLRPVRPLRRHARVNDLFLSPSLTSLDLVTELTQFDTDAEEPRTLIETVADPGVDTHLLARVHGTGSLSYTARISYRDGTGLPAANLIRVRTDHPADHVQAVAGAIVQGQGSAFALTPGSSFSLLVDEDIAAGNVVTIDVTLEAVDSGGAVIEHDIRFVLHRALICPRSAAEGSATERADGLDV